MSAFLVGKDHIDAMLTAGLNLGRRYHGSKLGWYVGERKDSDYQRGEVWGPTAIQSSQERHRELTRETAHKVGRMLLRQNEISVDHRYDEQNPPEFYRFQELPWGGGNRSALIALKAIACYEYQSCEDPAWEESEAKAFCDALRHLAIDSLEGYDDAEGWEVTRRDVFALLPKARTA